MYDIQQLFQLIKHTYNMFIEKDIQVIRRKNQKNIDVKILGHIIKYRLPSSIQGSPTWHRSQLQDLLKVVNFSVNLIFP
jgi:hypothetical protein